MPDRGSAAAWYAEVVGRDNVMAGADCGFGTMTGNTAATGAQAGVLVLKP
ncbi:MAG: hypothetical protein ACRDOH_34410 [Streptosporangiaceae bacterium]